MGAPGITGWEETMIWVSQVAERGSSGDILFMDSYRWKKMQGMTSVPAWSRMEVCPCCQISISYLRHAHTWRLIYLKEILLNKKIIMIFHDCISVDWTIGISLRGITRLITPETIPKHFGHWATWWLSNFYATLKHAWCGLRSHCIQATTSPTCNPPLPTSVGMSASFWFEKVSLQQVS